MHVQEESYADQTIAVQSAWAGGAGLCSEAGWGGGPVSHTARSVSRCVAARSQHSQAQNGALVK